MHCVTRFCDCISISCFKYIQQKNDNISGVNVEIVALNCFTILQSVDAVWKLGSAWML